MRLHCHKLIFSSYLAIIASLYCPIGKATDQLEIPIPPSSHPIPTDEALTLFHSHLCKLQLHISTCFKQLPEIFICYSSEEDDHRVKVTALFQDLVKAGISRDKILLDIKANPVGSGEEVLKYVQQIQTARKVIVAGSPSLKRKYEEYNDKIENHKQITAYELKLLLGERKQSELGLKGVIPLWFKGKAEDCFPKELTQIPYLDMTGDYAKYFIRDLLKALLAETPAIGAEDFLIDSHFLLFNKIRQQQSLPLQPAGSSTPQQSRPTQRLGFPGTLVEDASSVQTSPSSLIQESLLGAEKTKLLKQILGTTHAELDEAERIKRQLQQLLKSDQFSVLSLPLQKQLQHIQAKILPPEKLVWTEPHLGLFTSPSYDSLKPLYELIEELATLEHQLSSTKPITFLPVLQYYQAYLEKMLNASAEERQTLVQPRALLTAEGLADSNLESTFFYRLAQQVADPLRANYLPQFSIRFQAIPVMNLKLGQEVATYSLSQLLFNRGIAPPLIFAIHQPVAHSFLSSKRQFIKSLPQAMGITLEDYLKTNPQGTNIDPTSFSEHVLLSLLLQPSTLLPENFSLQQITDTSFLLVSDPYAGFFSQTNLVRNDKSDIQNILHYLPLMEQPIAPAVRKRILSLSPELFFLNWLAKLKQQEELFNNLYRAPYQPEIDPHHEVIRFKPGILSNLILRWNKIRLHLNDHPFSNHNQLLSYLNANETSNLSTETDSTQTIEETVAEVWENIDAPSQSSVLPYLELAVSAFPSVFQSPSTHESWKHSSILHRALIEGASSEIVKFLLRLGMELEWRHPQTQQTVFHAVLQDRFSSDIFTLLQSNSFKLSETDQAILINSADRQHRTPLDMAFDLGDIDIFLKLIEMGAYACKAELAVSFYKNQTSAPFLSQTFKKLMQLNPAVEWYVALEELLLSVAPNAQAQEIYLSMYGKRWIPKELEFKTIVEADGIHHRCVRRITTQAYGLYFKTYPALPGIEVAIGNFRRQLLGFGAPYVDLTLFEGKPTLISQAIPGETLEHVLRTNPERLNNLDEEDLAGVIVDAMLTNPEDGQAANIIVSPHPTKPGKDRLVGVDNDQALVPAVVQEQPQKTLFGKLVPIAQVKTILYCFDQMKKEIPVNLRNRLLSIDPARFLKKWLEEIKQINARHTTLFKEQPNMVKTLFKEHGCFIGIPFQKGAIRHLYEKLIQLRDLLSAQPSITLINLLAKLEPRLAKRYQGALDKNISVKERFKEVEQPFYEVIKDASNTVITRSGCILQSMDIPLKEDIFEAIRQGRDLGPNSALQELEEIKQEINTQKLESLGARAGDLNLLRTLKLETSRAAFLKRLREQGKILSPAEQTAVLEYLAQQTHLIELPLANFTIMNDTFIRNHLSLEHLRSLDLRRCERITNAALIKLAETALGLEELNLGFLPQLKAIGNIGYIQEAPLIFPALQTLNLTGCSNITRLLVTAPQLKWLNVSNCSKLTDEGLDALIDHSTQLTTLKLQGCPSISEGEIRELYPNCTSSLLKEIDKVPILKALKTKGTKLDLSYAVHNFNCHKTIFALSKVLAFKPNIISMHLCKVTLRAEGARAIAQSNFSNLKELYVETNNIGDVGAQAIARGNFSNLTELNIAGNNIGKEGAMAIAQSNLFNLTKLDIGSNNIGNAGAQALAEGNFSNLTNLNIGINKIDVAGAHALAEGKLSNLKTLNIECNNIGNRGAAAIAQGNLSNLMLLHIRFNFITDAGVRAIAQGNLFKLTGLHMRANMIGIIGAETISQGNFSKQFTSLDISWNRIGQMGMKFIAQGNLSNLTNLDISFSSIYDEGILALARGNLFKLLTLDIKENNISYTGAQAIAQGNFSSLTTLDIRRNNIGDAGAQAITQGNLPALKHLLIGYDSLITEAADNLRWQKYQISYYGLQ